MNKPNVSFSVEECKIQASVLLKLVRSNNIVIAEQAAIRFRRLSEFADYSLDQIMHAEIKRKHALLVIAIEKGFNTWSDLKCQLPFIRGGFLNQWFANYQEAKSYQQSNGGFILPFKKQFFICTEDYITNLGFDIHDPDWKLIGNDWVEPNDKSAWQRLYKKWMKIQGGRHE